MQNVHIFSAKCVLTSMGSALLGMVLYKSQARRGSPEGPLAASRACTVPRSVPLFASPLSSKMAKRSTRDGRLDRDGAQVLRRDEVLTIALLDILKIHDSLQTVLEEC